MTQTLSFPKVSLTEVLKARLKSDTGFLNPLVSLAQQHSDGFLIPAPKRPIIVVTHPELLKEIFHEKSRFYKKSYREMSRFLGGGLVTAEGEAWKRNRRRVAPLFHQKSLELFTTLMRDEARSLKDHWQSACLHKPHTVDTDFFRITLNIISRAMVSEPVRDEVQTINQNLKVITEYLSSRVASPLRLPLWVPSASRRRFDQAVASLDQVIFQMIQRRRKNGGPEDDLLGMLLRSRDEEDGSPLSDQEIRDELMTLLMAGHETTATSLAWAISLLGRNPKQILSLRKELQRLWGEEAPQDLKTLLEPPLLAATIKETLRLLPPIWFFERVTTEAHSIGKYSLPAHHAIGISPYLTHRHSEFWDDPEAFRPERFLTEDSHHKYAWFPFGGGARSCIGQGFALLELHLVLGTLVLNFDWELLAERGAPKISPFVTLQPKDGITIQLRERSLG